MVYYLVGLGSNIEPQINLTSACDVIAKHVEIVKHSHVLVNPALGETFHFPFHNQLLVIFSTLSKTQLKTLFESIEINLGREAKCPERKLNDRPIDIDILHHHQDYSQLLKYSLEESYNQEIMSNWKL
jgi:2-amino-4-hydroxy-6-hydroxymethyldihydropteridine diphosphokinase